MADQHDELVKMLESQTDPHLARASDFKVENAMGKHGDVPPGKDQLTPTVESPRHCEDDGPGPKGYGTPVGYDFSAAKIGSTFKVEKNKGEGNESPTQLKIPFSVDCVSGMIVPNVEHIRNKEA